MTSLRRFLQHRISAGACAVLLAYLLALQGAIGGLSQGTMASSAIGQTHFICSSSGTFALDQADGSEAPLKGSPDCPCATLCRLASASLPAILGQEAGLTIVRPGFSPITHVAAQAPPLQPRRGIIAEPRGPPASV